MATKDNLERVDLAEAPHSRRLLLRRIGLLAVSTPLTLAVLQACGGEEAEPTAEPEVVVDEPEETEEPTEEAEETEEPVDEVATPASATPRAGASPVAASPVAAAPVAASPVPEPPFAGTPVGSPVADDATPVT